ncbi:MAG: DUF4105 domain-containing protein [bacterium]
MRVRTILFALLMAGLSVDRGAAQGPPNVRPASVPGSTLIVTLATFGLGQEVFERFGHNALIFQDTLTGQSVAYHWGLFSFEEPGFLFRFLTGDTRYWMGAEDGMARVDAERRAGRPITLQRLNLTPAQVLALRNFVQRNALEENKFYRYDYFRDNCSTRLRDALDQAIGGAIRKASEPVRTDLTYRSESIRLTNGDAPVQAGIDIALGRPADLPLTQWESFFIPMRLRDAIRNVKVAGPNGAQVPLVASEVMVKLPPTPVPVPETMTVPRLTVRYAVLGLLLAALVVFLRIMMVSRRSAAWGLALFGAAWSLLSGVIGVILLLAWLATRHVFWAYNENVLLLSPISLLLAVLIPAALLSGKAERAVRMLAALVAAFGLIALPLAFIPGGQASSAIVALLLPVNIALAWALALPRGSGVPMSKSRRMPVAAPTSRAG